METTLHRQLKSLFGGTEEHTEVAVNGYRIDAIADGTLIEVQLASLGAIRAKVADLLTSHDVLVIKPLAATKRLIQRERRGGRVTSERTSPKHETLFHVFDDLVHFVDVFPHHRLTIQILLTEQEEHRVARRSRRWRGKNYRVEDRRLIGVTHREQLVSLRDLRMLLPGDLPECFTTADIAQRAGVPRWLAQKAAYCLRKTGAAQLTGKSGNALTYCWTVESSRKQRRRKAARLLSRPRPDRVHPPQPRSRCASPRRADRHTPPAMRGRRSD